MDERSRVEAQRFLEHLHINISPGSRITITAPLPRDDGAGVWWRSRHESDVESAVDAAFRADAEGFDAYVGLATRREGIDEYHRGGREDLLGLGCVWLDVDYGDKGHGSKRLPPDESAAVELIADLPLLPSMVVHSGGGLHVYWLLDQQHDPAQVESACVAWQARAIAAASARGWHLDKTSDSARVLRVPGTRNFKITGQPRSVTLEIGEDPPRYRLDEFAPVPKQIKSLGSISEVQSIAPITSVPIALAPLREALSEFRQSRSHSNDERHKKQADLVGRVLEGRSLGEPGELHRARVTLCGVLGYHLPLGTPWEAVLALLTPLLIATPVHPGTTYEATVEKTRELYKSSTRSREAWLAEKAEEDAQLKAFADGVRHRAAANAEDVARAAEAAGIESGEDAWQELLLCGRDGVRGCEYNAEHILRCEPELSGTIRWNERTLQVEVSGGPFAGVHPSSLAGAAASWMQRHYEFRGGEQIVRSALVRVARESPYDPVAEYLRELVWDGQARVDTFLEIYFGASAEGREKYVRAASRRWLVGLVARALRPGADVQEVLILEGPQGAGKTRGLQALASMQHYLGTSLALGEKDFLQQIAGAWLVELGELASFHRAESNKVKHFLSQRMDKFRPPYGAAQEEHPRRCVFVGTTNDSDYLVDLTGNRRYWPVLVGQVDVAAVERDRDLILAEAVQLFASGERWYFEGEEVAAQVTEVSEREVDSTVQQAIERWWYTMEPARRPRRLVAIDVASAISVSPERLDRALLTQFGVAMKTLGFRRREWPRPRWYEPTAEMLSAPKRSEFHANPLSIVRDPKGDRNV